jgi:hypothetical protein
MEEVTINFKYSSESSWPLKSGRSLSFDIVFYHSNYEIVTQVMEVCLHMSASVSSCVLRCADPTSEDSTKD